MIPMQHVQNAQARALLESPYYQAFLDIIFEIKTECNESGTVGMTDFETICLTVRRDERLLTLKYLIEKIEEHAGHSKI